MGDPSQDRWGAGAGFAALAAVAAAMAFEHGGPQPGASDAQVAAFYVEHAHVLQMQSLLFLVGAALLLWFLGGLRAFLAAAEGGPGRLSGTVSGAGVAYVALSVVAQAGQVAVARVAGAAAEPQLVAAMAGLAGALFIAVSVPAAVMLGAFAVLAMRVDAVPSWLGRLAAVAGVTQLGLLAGIVATTGPFALNGWYSVVPYPLYVVWLAATAVVMARRPGRRASVGATAVPRPR